MSLMKKLADKYDPSIMGAIGLLLPFFVAGVVVATPVAAALGAGAAMLFGAAASTGAYVGAGIVGTWATVIGGMNIVAPFVYQWAYEQEVREHVRNGGSTSGCKYFPGIKDIKPYKPPQGITPAFNAPQSKAQPPQQGPQHLPPAPPKP